jgi:hypothetical protein
MMARGYPMTTRLWLAAAALLVLPLAGDPALAGRDGGHRQGQSCQTLLGKWRQAGDNHHMRKAMNKQDKIARKMAKRDCPVPVR